MRKKLALLLIAWLALCAPAFAVQLLPTLTITTAVTNQVSPMFQLRGGGGQGEFPTNFTLQGKFVYGSGGTSADAYVQTSIDGGQTWTDVANFHFTTSSATFIYNLNSSVSVTTEYVPTDGSLAANTAKDGVFGSQWRIKFTTVGTYAGGTTLRVDGYSDGLTAFP